MITLNLLENKYNIWDFIIIWVVLYCYGSIRYLILSNGLFRKLLAIDSSAVLNGVKEATQSVHLGFFMAEAGDRKRRPQEG